MARSLVVNDDIQIPGSEIAMSFARSSGPGGQNVNKVNSKAVLRWNVALSERLPPGVKQRFLQRFSRRINQDGELVLDSDQHREQARNVSECYEKLRQLILSVLAAPRARKQTRPTRGSIERRLQNKRHASWRKQSRSYRAGSDD